MRILAGFLLIAFSVLKVQSQNAYEITANIKPYTNGHLYLAYHFGNKQYLLDSAKIGENGNAVFTGTKNLQGGVYMIVYPEKNSWVECIIDKQQKFTITTDTSNAILNMQFEGSSDNVLFSTYQKKSLEIGKQVAGLRAAASQATTPSNAEDINSKIRGLNLEMLKYRDAFQKEHPTHLLTSIFNLLKDPEIPPAAKHPGGKYDSVYAYNFYKSHYWDGISFTDERLMRTPVLQQRLDRYFNNILPQMSDSLIVYADQILKASKPNEEMFKYFLSSLTDKYVNPQYMGQDAVFVHLFEKYYLTGAADAWMSEAYKKYVFERGYSMMANVIGKRAAELPMIDTLGKNFSLYAVQAPFTVLCFWDPTCGHCQEEVPKVDSIFQNKWKKEGVKLIGIMTDGGKENWLKFIKEHKLIDWVHIYQTDETKEKILKAQQPGYRQLYDVYQTPMLYLLDKDKNIAAKKLTFLQIDDYIEFRKKNSK